MTPAHLNTRKQSLEYFAELLPEKAQRQYLETVYELFLAFDQEMKRQVHEEACATSSHHEVVEFVKKIIAEEDGVPTDPPE